MRLSLCIIAILTTACTPDDNGLMIINGVDVTPLYIPFEIAITKEANEEISSISDAYEWINSTASRDGIQRTFFVESYEKHNSPGVILIDVGYLPSGIYGLFEFDYNINYQIITGVITISYDITYDQNTTYQTLKHELGHALGLADDHHSIDLNSFMDTPPNYNGIMTDNDYNILKDIYDGY